MIVSTGKILGNKGCSHYFILSLRPKTGLRLGETAGPDGTENRPGIEEPAGPDLGGVRTSGFDHLA
ncbi:hypothetical protein NicSoilC12_11800 [Arthrobacter sp. NicSoilC12]|nr:hypothetical protein NicSoilC12_11800 [Arthrobacter sp. NicSoilC12]